MDMAAPHVGFVIAAYGISAAVILGLLANVLIRARSLRKELADTGLHDPGSAGDAP